METKLIELKPVEMVYGSDGIGIGFSIKRDITKEEALYILEKILEFEREMNEEREDIKRSDWDETVEEYEKECTTALNNFIKGTDDWVELCNQCRVVDEFFSFVPIVEMINYLQEKEII